MSRENIHESKLSLSLSLFKQTHVGTEPKQASATVFLVVSAMLQSATRCSPTLCTSLVPLPDRKTSRADPWCPLTLSLAWQTNRKEKASFARGARCNVLLLAITFPKATRAKNIALPRMFTLLLRSVVADFIHRRASKEKKKKEKRKKKERKGWKEKAKREERSLSWQFGTLLPRYFRVFRRDTLIVFGEPSPRARRQMKFVASFCNVSLFEETGKQVTVEDEEEEEEKRENRNRGEARISLLRLRLSAT